MNVGGGGQFEMFALTPLGRGSATLGVPKAPLGRAVGHFGN